MDGLQPADQNRIFGFASQYLDNPKDFSSCALVCKRWNAMLNLESGSGEKGLALRAQKLVVEKYLQEHLQIKPEIASTLMAMKPKEWTHLRFASELKTKSKPLSHPHPSMTWKELNALRRRVFFFTSCVKLCGYLGLCGCLTGLYFNVFSDSVIRRFAGFFCLAFVCAPQISNYVNGLPHRINYSIWLPGRKSAAQNQLMYGFWREQLAIAIIIFILWSTDSYQDKLLPKGHFSNWLCGATIWGVIVLLVENKIKHRLCTLLSDRGEDDRGFPAGWCAGQAVWSGIKEIRGYRLDIDARYCLLLKKQFGYAQLDPERLYWFQDFVQRMNWDRSSDIQHNALKWLVGQTFNKYHGQDFNEFEGLVVWRSADSHDFYDADLLKTVEWLREEGRHRVEDVYANPLVFQG